MGSGKSTVGPLLAEELGWDFRDFDREVEARAGRSVPEIFREDGEEAFRDLEHRAARSLLGLSESVLAAGGGWPCRPGRLESLGSDTLTIWLRVSAPVAVARSAGDAGARPLLQGEAPLGRAQELLDRRLPYYRLAHWSVDSESGPPEELARRIADHLMKCPGRPLRA
jgi:shikimate kinase